MRFDFWGHGAWRKESKMNLEALKEVDKNFNSLIQKWKKESEMSGENDSEVDSACQVCGELGEDKRRIFVDCGWDMSKMAAPFKLVQGEFPARGYDMYFCKDCRTKFLTAVDDWFGKYYCEPEIPKTKTVNFPCNCEKCEKLISVGDGVYYGEKGGLWCSVCASKPVEKTCEWTIDNIGMWLSGCGHQFGYAHGDSLTNRIDNYPFCVQCGGKIVEKETAT